LLPLLLTFATVTAIVVLFFITVKF